MTSSHSLGTVHGIQAEIPRELFHVARKSRVYDASASVIAFTVAAAVAAAAAAAVVDCDIFIFNFFHFFGRGSFRASLSRLCILVHFRF